MWERQRLITGGCEIWDLEILRWIWGRSWCCFDQSFLGGDKDTGRWRGIERGVGEASLDESCRKERGPRRRGEDHGGLEGGPFTWVRD